MTSSSRIALGVGALFLGGLVGGVLGAWMVGRAPAATTTVPRDDGTQAELARVVRELADAVAGLGRAEPVVAGPARPSERAPAAATDAASGVHDLDRIVAALEGLTAALDAAATRGVGTGAVDAPVRLVPPAGGTDRAAIEQLAGRDYESLRREFMLWNRQQVLERFGPPDEIGGDGQWIYRWQAPGSTKTAEATFKFVDGFVRAVVAP